jgi:predicted O-methyltransferase YrrM
MVATFRSLRRDRTSSEAFLSVWSAIDSVDGWLTRPEAELMFVLAGVISPSRAVVEIGSYCGRSTAALAFGTGRRKQSVYAVDPHTGDRSQVEAGLSVDTFETFLSNVRRLGLADAVVAVRALSVEAAGAYKGPEIGLLLVDGWHSTQAVTDDVTSWSPYFASDVIVVFDDFRFPEVAAGIAAVRNLLPEPLGSVGKDFVFASPALLNEVPRLARILDVTPGGRPEES